MDIAQILANSLIRASELSLLAIGLTMVFDILKFANFAHGDYAILGAFLAWVCNQVLGLNLFIAVAMAALLTGFVGICLEQVVFKPLRLKGVKPFTLMIASMGIALALRNVIRMIWSSGTRNYDLPIFRPMDILGAKVTPIQLSIVVVGIASMFAFHLLLHKTKFGKALRAISDNSELASACAIDSERMILFMWFLACAYGVIGGTMIAMEHVLYPRLGFDILIPVFCAAILGGIGNPYGAMLGALTLALSENIILTLDLSVLLNLGGVFDFDSIQIATGYKPAVSFIILIIMLLIRPTGILGRK
jgi:branched-subunit amino acid ABC-type transport system permease component